jgi:hypothetical protein
MTAPFRPDDASTFVAVESSFASSTTPTMLRATPIAGTFEADIQIAELDNNCESVLLHDLHDPVMGQKSGGCKFCYYVNPPIAQLTNAGGDGDAGAIALLALFKGIIGVGAQAKGQPTSGASTTTSIDVTSATDLRAGQWVLPQVSGSYEPCRIGSIATNTLTWDLKPSATPTTAATPDTLGMYNFVPDPANTSSLYIQHANANETTNEKYEFRGCTGDVQFTFNQNQLLVANFDLKAATWTTPSDDSIAVTVGNDGMGSPFALKDATVILQSASVGTRTQYGIAGFSMKLNLGMEHNRGIGGDTEGNLGVMRTGQRLFAEASVRLYADATDTATIVGYHTNRTALQFVVMVPSGSGTSKRWVVFDMPKCIVVGRPKPVKDGGRMMLDVTLQSKIRNTSGTTLQGRTPFVLAIG